MPIKKVLLFAIGFVLVIGGVTLTIKDWPYLRMVFQGVIGPLLAVIGLVVLTMTRE